MTLLTIAIVLAALTIACLVAERRGVNTSLHLSFKGDLKRETAFVAQYGQAVATPLAGWLMAIARGNDWRAFALVCAPVVVTSVVCVTLKRLFGRMRPNRDRAGAFTGPAWRHDNARESFPSSHSACAVALTVTLVHLWPEAAIPFWVLAIATALLRYVMVAHFPSDVLAGCLIGLGLGHAGLAATAAAIDAVAPAE